jgi:hypothetical protein
LPVGFPRSNSNRQEMPMRYAIHFYDHHVSGTDTPSELDNEGVYDSFEAAALVARKVCERVNREDADGSVDLRYRIIEAAPSEER